MRKTFYTIRNNEGFINSNTFRDKTENPLEAIRFDELEDAEYYFKHLRKDKGFKIIKVNCEFTIMEVRS